MSIAKIAELAGVSNSTVSRVINDHPTVSEGNVRKVKRAMRQLNYTPPIRRRGPRHLSRQGIRTGNVAMLMLNLEPSFFAQAPVLASALHGVSDALVENGLDAPFVSIRSESGALRLPPAVESRRVDGVIVMGDAAWPALAEQLKGIPAVRALGMAPSDPLLADVVQPDNEAVAQLACDYLMARGHRRLACLCPVRGHPAYDPRMQEFAAHATARDAAAERLAGDLRERQMREQRINLHEPVIAALLDRLLALDPRPTGLFVPGDMLGAAAFGMLAQRGIRPGVDIDLIFCNNEEPVLARLDPRPATIDIHAELIGRRAVEQLLWRMRHRDDPQEKVLVHPTVVPAAGQWPPAGCE